MSVSRRASVFLGCLGASLLLAPTALAQTAGAGASTTTGFSADATGQD
jgi:hypothetical protein